MANRSPHRLLQHPNCCHFPLKAKKSHFSTIFINMLNYNQLIPFTGYLNLSYLLPYFNLFSEYYIHY